MSFTPIDEVLERVRQGEMVLVADSEDRENEGDLAFAAERVTPELINFLATHARGLVCVPCDPQRLDLLEIHPMCLSNTSFQETAFTVTVDFVGVGSGISAHDRSNTIRHLVNPSAKPDDFLRPGHVMPLRAKPGGVLERPGHTEASVDLARLAGLTPCSVICEVLNTDGSVARIADLVTFAKSHSIPLVSIEDLIDYRTAHEAAHLNGSSIRR